MSILIKGMDKPTDCGLCPFEDFGYCNVKGERNTSERGIDADCPLIEIADRPQGEWIKTGRTNIYGGIEVQCSNCGDKVMVQHLEDEWYCRHCGADMGMKGADDESVDSN